MTYGRTQCVRRARTAGPPLLLGAMLLAAPLAFAVEPQEEAFPDNDDVLAVDSQDDGSSSIRVAGAPVQVSPCLLRVSLEWRETDLPSCVFVARVVQAAQPACRSQIARRARLTGRYRFAPLIGTRAGEVDLDDSLTRQNLGACYYPPRTELLIEVAGVDFERRRFRALRVYRVDGPDSPR